MSIHPGRVVHGYLDDDYNYIQDADRPKILRKLGYKHVAGIYYGGYSWDCADVFRRISDGRLVWSEDGGCSCYGPYEYASDEESLMDLDDYRSFRDKVNERFQYHYINPGELQDFLAKVQRAMRSKRKVKS